MSAPETYTYRLGETLADGDTWESSETYTRVASGLRADVHQGHRPGTRRVAYDAATEAPLYGLDAQGNAVRRLAWGLDPDDTSERIVRAAWGARALYDGLTLSLLHDRQDAIGSPDERRAVAAWVAAHAWPILVDLAATRDLPGTREHGQYRLAGDGGVLLAEPRGSCGYLYLGAWLDPDEAQPLPRPAARVTTQGRCRECRAMPGRRHEDACTRAYPQAPRAARAGRVSP